MLGKNPKANNFYINIATQKIRLDKLLVDRGIAPTLERARALILARAVKVNDVYLDKAGVPVGVDSEIHIKGEDNPYVSRGGLKLKEALKEFNLDRVHHRYTRHKHSQHLSGLTPCFPASLVFPAQPRFENGFFDRLYDHRINGFF
jgi:ribosomal protein S4